MLALSIPIALPSQNKYLGRGFWNLHNDKKLFQQHLGHAFLVAKANGHVSKEFIPPCVVKRSVKIVTYRRRFIDQDNLSCKALLDALTRLEFIKDDSPRWIDLKQPVQLKVGRDVPEWTLIELRNVR